MILNVLVFLLEVYYYLTYFSFFCRNDRTIPFMGPVENILVINGSTFSSRFVEIKSCYEKGFCTLKKFLRLRLFFGLFSLSTMTQRIFQSCICNILNPLSRRHEYDREEDKINETPVH